MAWINVNKPTTSSWTKTTFAGQRTYDDSAVSYDDANTSFDDRVMWTNVAKPIGEFLLTKGMYIGPLGLTYSRNTPVGGWRYVAKPQ